MKNNIAIIDLGSNLTKLVVVAGELPLRVIHRSIYDTKTLKSAPKGLFDENSIARIESDITKVLEVAKSFDCATTLGIATSAFRTRKNGKKVISDINIKFKTDIQIIEGEREAQLIYDGALASVKVNSFPVLVMDIGGGSTEFIIGNETKTLWKHSFDFGSTALIKDVLISNPLTTENVSDLYSKLEVHLAPLFEKLKEFSPQTFIGTTGAFESFAQITESDKGDDFPVPSGYEYNLIALNTTLQNLILSSTEERTKLKGINALRVPTIHVAALILNFVFEKYTAKTHLLSLGDVKEGLALEFLEKNI